ncbi:LOW QUALITY PROTEIN: uncharacterized protein [Palaemon carinicauda]|uniref:LOW QUALITY PROTEIN: uncharacterized protein n=1 Tax=Palaemon carinicauda TaxID=392227 RepID=UPI0035B5D7FE
MEINERDTLGKTEVIPRARWTYDDPRTLRGFRRRLSESARDAHGDGFYRLARLSSGLRRRLSGSTRDLFSSVVSPVGTSFDEVNTISPNDIRQQLSASMKDLLLHGGAGGTGGPRGEDGNSEGIGRKLSRRLSLLADTVANRADLTRGSLRARLPNLKKSRSFSVGVILPDSSTRTVICEGGQTAGQAMSSLVQELRLATYSLALADSQAEVDLDAPAHLLDGDTVILRDAIDTYDPSTELEPRLRIAVVMAATERTLCGRLRCVEEVYGRHLRRLSSVSPEEHDILFRSVEPLVEASEAFIKRTANERKTPPGWKVDLGLTSRIAKFSDDTKLGINAADSEDLEALREDLIELGEWSEKGQMPFNCGKCKFMHIGCNNPQSDYILLGAVFDDEMWDVYETYFDQYQEAISILREKHSNDEEFVALCKLRRGAARHSLIYLLHLPVERLSDYEKHFASLLVDTHPDHPDRHHLSHHHDRLTKLVRRGEEEESEIERIQDLFPHDDLRLYERDPVTQKMKGLMRKRSTTAARLQRAFSAKGLRGPDHQHNNNREAANNNNTNNAANTSGLPPNRTREGRPKRQFIMETPVTFTTGVQSQERHLFLFSDLLLVAKARSGGNFKLKEKVRVSEMWLSSCLDDVAEVAKSHDTSFVMGWPTTNVVASFSCVATKDLWYNKLSQVMTEEREKEQPTTTIQVTYYDPVNNIDFSKTVNIGSTTTARECVSLTLDHLEMGDADSSQFQLWVKTGVDDSPYPLIGHEFPFSIKMNCVRDLLQDCDTEQCNNLYNTELVTRCQFILRQARKLSFESPEGVKKVSKKARKSPIRIHRVFKRSNSKGDSLDGGVNNCTGVLYGRSLTKLVEPDNTLPKPVMDMLTQLFLKGPFTVGIFRKSANARLVRELREKLDSGDVEGAVDLDNVQITVVAALLKEFLRSMPDCLLVSDLYEEWLELTHIAGFRERISQTLLLCSRLPRAHLKLLQHFLCVLHHIVRRASENMMSASNLAVCVGPSILWPSSPVLALSQEDSKQVPAVVEFLIERCRDIFGEDILHLLGEPPERDPLRQDSGAEESDSLHSLHSGHSLHSSGGMRRDDSSIDSLERELLEGELSPLPRKDKMSLTNLSRDSGLTMSDSQLYTPDEEESESTSSGHSGADKSVSNYSSGGQSERSGDRIQHYTAPHNPHAIYAAVYRRPEKIPVEYDDPESYYAAPSRDHARIQVTYSNSGYPYHPHGHGKEYTRVYQSRQDRLGDAYRKCQEEESIYSIPVGATGNMMINPPPFVVNSNFQRHDWMRRRSNLRKVSRSSSGEGGLVRSTSEESLLNKYNGLDYGVSLGPAGVANKRPAQHGKGRAPPPPPEEQDDCTMGLAGRDSPIRRSKSAHYLTEPSRDERASRSPDNTPAVSRSSSHDAVAWQRSRSTPQIHDEADRSYDSSTLSDDDSTPHVSRSNSRGKECGGGGLNAWDVVYGTEHTPSDSGDSHNSCNSSFKSERTGSMCTVVSAGSTSTIGSNPPSYEEALNRKSLMYRGGPQQSHQAQNSPAGKECQFQEHAIREEKVKSARAKQLYEESLRLYQEENTYPGDLVRASPAHADVSDEYEKPPPLPPKSEPPPLPPKQRGSRRLSEGLNRLKHLPPVHVETHNRKSRSVSSIPASYNCDPPYHKTIICTDDSPPLLPPKERTVIEIESVYLPIPESRVRQTTSRAVSPPRVEKKSIETQTDDYDLDDEVKDEGIQTSGTWAMEPHVTSVSVSDQPSRTEKHRSRARRRDSSASQRSKSVPTRENVPPQHQESDDDDDDWEYASPLQDYPGAPAALRDLRQLDPELRQEISWSVSQLRAIFGDSLNGAKVHPPPYRPPPTSHRAPITSYHLGAGDSFSSRKSRPHSNYGEESYV